MIRDLIIKDILTKLNDDKLVVIGEGETRIVYDYQNYVVKIDKFDGQYNKAEYELFQQYQNNKNFLYCFIECYYISNNFKLIICEKVKPLIEYLDEIDKLNIETKCINEIAKDLNLKVDWEYIYNICQYTGLALEEVYDGTNYGIRNDNTLVVMDYAEFI